MAEPALSPSAVLVRRLDYDRFATALFAPARRRESLLALYAFNVEIARIRETVTEPMLGQIRLQWWREAVGESYDGKTPRRHAVAEALAAAIDGTNLTKAYFDCIIDAREFDLMGAAPPRLDDLETYAKGTAATLHWLGADLLGIRGDAVRDAIFDIGAAWALVGLIRAIPFHARAKRQFIPADIAAATGLKEQDLFELRPTPALAAAVERLADRAACLLARARNAGARMNRATRPLLLFAPLADAYLAELKRAKYDVMRQPIEIGKARKLALLWWAAARGRY